MLSKTGFEVFGAANGSAAIDVLHAEGCRIDLILLDMTIPGHSSQEVVIEAAQARPDIKVILTSAYSQEAAEANVVAPQIRGFIRKPFPLDALVQMIGKVLSL